MTPNLVVMRSIRTFGANLCRYRIAVVHRLAKSVARVQIPLLAPPYMRLVVYWYARWVVAPQV